MNKYLNAFSMIKARLRTDCITKKHLILAALLGFLVVVSLAIAMIHPSKSKTHDHNNTVSYSQLPLRAGENKNLLALGARVDQLSIHLQRSMLELDHLTREKFAHINQSNQALSAQIKNINQRDLEFRSQTKASIDQINEAISTMGHELNQKIESLSNQFTQILKAKSAQQKILNADQLPFKVMSVEWWNDYQRVAVRVNNTGKYALLAPGDRLSGWVLSKIENAKVSTLVFTNAKGQIIRVWL